MLPSVLPCTQNGSSASLQPSGAREHVPLSVAASGSAELDASVVLPGHSDARAEQRDVAMSDACADAQPQLQQGLVKACPTGSQQEAQRMPAPDTAASTALASTGDVPHSKVTSVGIPQSPGLRRKRPLSALFQSTASEPLAAIVAASGLHQRSLSAVAQEENKLARTAATLLIRTPKPSLCKMQPGQLLDDAVCQSATHGHKESPSSSAAAQDLASQLAASVSLGQEPPSALASTPRAQRIASWQPPKPPRSTSLTTAAPSAPAEVPRAESPVQHRRGRQSRSGNVGWERSSAPMPHMRSTPLDVTRQSVQDILKHDQTILSTLQPIRTSASALGKALKPGEQITSCPQLALPAATAARHSAGAAATSLSASTTTGQIPLPELGLGAVPEVESAAALLAQRLAAAEQQVLQRRMSSLRSAAYAPDAFNAFLTTAAPVRTDAAAYPTTKFTDTQQCAAGAIGKKLSIKMFPSPSQGPLDITVDASAAAQAQAHMPGTARASGGQGAYAMLASVDSADVAACDAPLRSSPFACQAVTPSDSCFSSPECFSATNTATASTPASRAVPGSGQLDGVWSSAAQSTAAGPSLLELHSGMVSNDDLLAVEEPFTPTAAAAAAASASAAQMLRAFERQMVAAGRNGSE